MSQSYKSSKQYQHFEESIHCVVLTALAVAILVETYNAVLESMLAPLKLLAQTPGNRRIAVLGTMKELGDRSLEFHQQVGESAQQLNFDALFILADLPEAEAMAKGAEGLSVV